MVNHLLDKLLRQSGQLGTVWCPVAFLVLLIASIIVQLHLLTLTLLLGLASTPCRSGSFATWVLVLAFGFLVLALED